jgi:hypothetical protein
MHEMTTPPMWPGFQEALDDPIVVGSTADDLNREIKANTWWLSVPDDIRATMSRNDVARFLEALMRDRSAQIRRMKATHGMIFYVWFDELAAQLRFSLISDVHERLPFGCSIRLLLSPDTIIDAFLQSGGGYLPWADFVEPDPSTSLELDEAADDYTLDVYSVRIPDNEPYLQRD